MNNFIEQMNEIVGKIDVMIDALESEEEMVQTAFNMVGDLDIYLTDKDLLPNGFDADEMMADILIEYWNNQEEVQEVVDMLDEFHQDVFNYLMENEDDEEIKILSEDSLIWYNKLRDCEENTVRNMIDMIDSEIKDEINDYIDDYIKNH